MKSKTALRFASLFALNPSAAISLTSTLAALLARPAALWTALGGVALMATSAHPARAAAVTEAWVHRYSNVVSNAAGIETVKVVRDGVGDIIVTGATDNEMLTIKYSGADGSVLWQRRYNGPAARGLAVDASGNVAVTGTGYYTARYAAADGALLWEKRYNSPGNHEADIANAVAVDGSGNVVVTGYSFGSESVDYYTAKYAASDGALLWEKRYNTGPGYSENQAQAVAVDNGGNVVVTGFSGRWPDHDYYTAKYAAADGALLWEKRYKGPANSEDYAKAVAVDGSGNVIATGFSSNSGDIYDTDYYTAKYAAADGTLLWEKRYNGPANRGDVPSAVAVDSSSNVVVTGFSNNNGGPDDDYYTAKYAATDGALLWEKSYNGPANGDDSARALALDGSGNVIVTGYSSDPDKDLDPNNGLDYYTAEYAAADGALLWEKRSNGWGEAVAVDGTGNVVVTGNFSTAKFAAVSGVLLWEKRYQGPAHLPAFATALAVDGSGNVVVTGSATRELGIRFVKRSTSDYYTAKYAVANGALLWEHAYNGPANDDDQAQALALDGIGNVVVTGFSYNGSNKDYYTVKYAAANGALLWEQRYNGPANEDDSASALAVDGSGNVVVTGISDNGLKTDYYTAKYAAADGALLWEQRSNVLTPDHDGPSGLVVDASGNVVVTGYSNNGTNSDYYTAKYAAVNGALLWEQRYNGPANDDDRAAVVALDGSGNVIVTGYSFGRGSSGDYYTAKYAAADGALLWEQRYNGPANDDDSAQAVAVDISGNVVVTGFSHNGSGNYDYYTAKYSAADGALIWEKRYNGPANNEDFATAVAMDVNGNVVVTGSSYNTNDPDYYTVKYAAADGALLWEKRHSGLANGGDRSHRLALGPNGMVAITGGSDYVTIVYREPLPAISVERVPTGIRLRFAGDSGRTYTIERSLAVAGPWTPITTPTAPIGGLIEYVDTNTSLLTAFYRTSTP